MFSDASDSGFGGYAAIVGHHKSVGHWGKFEAAQSSTFRELKAIQFILQLFTKVLAHHKVKWFSDSQNCCSIVNVGSPKPHLQSIAVKIFFTCVCYSISSWR